MLWRLGEALGRWKQERVGRRLFRKAIPDRLRIRVAIQLRTGRGRWWWMRQYVTAVGPDHQRPGSQTWPSHWKNQIQSRPCSLHLPYPVQSETLYYHRPPHLQALRSPLNSSLPISPSVTSPPPIHSCQPGSRHKMPFHGSTRPDVSLQSSPCEARSRHRPRTGHPSTSNRCWRPPRVLL